MDNSRFGACDLDPTYSTVGTAYPKDLCEILSAMEVHHLVSGHLVRANLPLKKLQAIRNASDKNHDRTILSYMELIRLD